MKIQYFNSLLNKNESGNLEFKREWYWKENDEKETIKCGWGEFLKDFASLVNANSNYFNQKRFLIFGVTNDKKLIGIEHPEHDLIKFKKKTDESINKFFNFVPDYKFVEIEKENKKFIIVIIEQPDKILIVKKEFVDKKNNPCRVNSIFVRGTTEKEDQIDLCSTEELSRLNKLLNIKDELNDRNHNISVKIEYRNIDKAIECFLKVNNTYSLIKSPLNISNTSLKYKAKLYSFSDSFDNVITFLYVNSSSNIKQLIKKINEDNIITDKFTLITDLPITIDPITRLTNLENSFKEAKLNMTKVIYLHEFGVNYLYRNVLKDIEFKKFPVNQSYVESYASIKSSNSVKKAHKILDDWYKEVYNPIIVIQGEGGIGKTTLVKNQVNRISTLSADTKIIYMSSSDILKKIDADEYESNIVLYDFYNIGNINNHNKFDKDLLKFSLDDGKVILVLDGIDEVISSLGSKFDFDFFIKDIVDEYCFNNGNCKVLLTCRHQFWEQLNYDTNESITVINLNPFDEDQVKEYFGKAFKAEKKIKESMQYTQKFSKNTTEYSPFMLDTIKYLVERKHEKQMDDNSLLEDETNDYPNNFILLNDNSNDFLIYSICNREKIKLGIYNFEEQLDIFIKLAIEFNGEIQITQLNKIYAKIDNYSAISLSSHPLLLKITDYSGEKLTFKYDFLKSYFEELFIAKTISNLDHENVNLFFLKSLQNIGYANQLSNNILNRVKSKIQNSENEFLEYCLYTLEEIKNEGDNLENKIMYSNFIILSIYLYIKIFSKTADDFISEILGNANIIEHLYLINLSKTYNSSKKLILSFAGKTIKNSHFQHYDFFWDCKFDQNTIFVDCNIKEIKNKPPKNIQISRNAFDGCNSDSEFKNVLFGLVDSKENARLKNKKHVFRILKIFISNGNFLPQKIGRINSEVSKFSGNHILEKLLKNNVIIKHIDSYMSDDEYIISPDYEDLLDTITQGNSSVKMNSIIQMISYN